MSFVQRQATDIYLPADAISTRLRALQVHQIELSEATRAILKGIARQLHSAHDLGATYESLSAALGQTGIEVGSGALETFLREHQKQAEAAGDSAAPTGAMAVQLNTTAIEAGLRTALATGDGLFLQYQPQVDMDTGEVIGAEALVRWRNGSVLVSPVDFIPVAEHCGLIGEIGAWAMKEACAEAVRWRGIGLGQGQGIKISVNLSVKQFSEQLVQEISMVLLEAGLSTDLFSVEITESFLAGDKAHHILQSLNDMGVEIAIDDFGTGYSCLSRVSSLPLDTIKIDREFVTPLGSSSAADAVAETIIALANKLGMSTIAEGVETNVQVQALKALGCKVAQGFLYAKPLSSGEFIEFVRSREKDLDLT